MLNKYYLKDNLGKKIVIIFAILALLAYGFFFPFKKSYANEITLFPSVCEGSWQNATAVAGDPAEETGGAQSLSSGDIINCHSFSGESLPEGVTITSAYVEFIWTVNKKSEELPAPSIEDSYDPNPLPIAPTENLEEGLTKEEPIKDIPASIEEVSPTIEQPSVESSPEEPTSYLPKLKQVFFIPIAQAEEATPVSSESVNLPPEPSVSDNSKIEALEPENISSVEEKLPDVNESEKELINKSDVFLKNEEVIPSENSSTPSPQEEGNNEIAANGTPLFAIIYSLPSKNQQPLGHIMQEQLNDRYGINVDISEIPDLEVSLTSLLTIDSVKNLTLQGIQLVVRYDEPKQEDPIRQPDLTVDTVLDDIRSEDTRVIRIQRADNKEYEIWYRSLGAEAQENSKQEKIENPTVEDQQQGDTIKDDKFITSDSEVISDIISPESLKTPLIKSDNEIRTPAEANTSVIDSSIQSVIPSPPTTDARWNFVVGHNLINSSFPIAFKDGVIFWVNQPGNALYTFTILTQGIYSSSYQPDQGENSITYKNSSNQEKEARYEAESGQFIFPN